MLATERPVLKPIAGLSARAEAEVTPTVRTTSWPTVPSPWHSSCITHRSFVQSLTSLGLPSSQLPIYFSGYVFFPTKPRGALRGKEILGDAGYWGACFQIAEMNLLMDRFRPRRQCCGKNCRPCPLPSLYSDSDLNAGLARAHAENWTSVTPKHTPFSEICNFIISWPNESSRRETQTFHWDLFCALFWWVWFFFSLSCFSNPIHYKKYRFFQNWLLK